MRAQVTHCVGKRARVSQDDSIGLREQPDVIRNDNGAGTKVLICALYAFDIP